jgi:glycosyltransferase involved in cell wall biosynthesis
MRILLIDNYPEYRAVSNSTYNLQELGLAKALVRAGHVCDILFWTNKDESEVRIPINGKNSSGICVYYRRGKTALKNTIYSGCNKLFESYDILQPCEYNQMQAWILAKRYPNKTIIYHGPYYSPFNKRYNLACKIFDLLFLNRYIKLGTPFVVKSELAKQFLIGKGIASNNISVAGVGIDVDMLESNEQLSENQFYLDMKNGTSYPKILYIGKIEPRRRTDFLFDVFFKVLQEIPDSSLYMIGDGEDNYVNGVMEYAKSLKIQDKIIWKRKMEQKYLSNIYKLGDFFILPTEYEIFGMVLLEAMYYRNVVVTTDNGGSSTLIDTGKNGFVLDSFDADKWADLILKMSKQTVKCEQIKDNARETINSNFRWDSLVDTFINQYISLLNSHK